MKQVLISLGFAALALGATAQVKIKDGSVTGSSTTPNSNAILELESNNKGLLYPRVSLTSLTAPLNGGAMVAGMVVYDTATVAASGITPGLYYNTGTQWVRVANNSANTNTAFTYGVGTPAAAGATCNGTAQNTIYVDTGSASATLGQTWICDGTNWQAYNAPASTEWYLAGSNSTDAGASKTVDIVRTGRVVIGGGKPDSVSLSTSGSPAAAKRASFTVHGGDASINGLNIGMGGGQNLRNTAVGYQVLQSNTSGIHNTAVGSATLDSNSTGNDNTAVGFRALQVNTIGYFNTAFGSESLYSVINGSNNTAIGFQALQQDTSGSYNTALGYNAGANLASGGDNIAIGYDANFPNGIGNYQLNIGNAIWGTGVDSTTTNAANIGINTSAPNSSLYVNGSFGLPFQTRTANYTLGARDYTVRFTGGAATLPDPTNGGVTPNLSGRMYRIVNATGAAMTVSTESGTVTLLNGTQLANNTSALFQTDGTNWYQVQ